MSNDFMERLKNPATGELRPDNADGLSPNTPIQQSPLSAADRLKLSFGDNDPTEFLTERYGEAKLNKFGKYVVPVNNLWHQVDPKNFGDGDAWDKTKEFVKDLGDIAPEGGFVVASAGAAALTGGASIPLQLAAQGAAGAGTELIRTSLGRAIGTYNASPAEQVKDIATEALLMLGGEAVSLGVKPTAKMMGNALKNIAKKLPAGDRASRMVVDTLGAMSGMGGDNVARHIDRPDQVGRILDILDSSGASTGGMIEKAVDRQTDDVLELLENVYSSRSAAYKASLKQASELVDNTFKFSQADGMHGVVSQLEKMGVLFKKGSKLGVDEATMTAASAGRWQVKASSKEILENLESSGFSRLADALSADPAAMRHFKTFSNRMAILAKDATKKSGKEGLDLAISLDQKLNKIIDSAFRTKKVSEVPELLNFIKQMKTTFRGGADDVANGGLDDLIKARMGSNRAAIEAYEAGRKHFAEDSANLKFLLDEQEKIMRVRYGMGSGDERIIAQGLLQKLSAGAGRNQAQKSAVERALARYSTQTPKIGALYDNILDYEAAKAAVPQIRGQFLQFGVVLGAGGAVMSGDIAKAAGGAVLPGVLTSPRAIARGLQQYGVIKAGGTLSNKTMQSLAANGFKLLDALKKRPVGEAAVRIGEDIMADELNPVKAAMVAAWIRSAKNSEDMLEALTMQSGQDVRGPNAEEVHESMMSGYSNEPSQSQRVDSITQKQLLADEGYAGQLKKSISKSEATNMFGKFKLTGGEPSSRIEGTGPYGLYYDSKGILTGGIGDKITSQKEAEQYLDPAKSEATAKQKWQENYAEHKDRIANGRRKTGIKTFNNLSEELQSALINSAFRGGITGSPKTRKLIDQRRYLEAAEEFKRHPDWKEPALRKRMERVVEALKAEAKR